MTDDQNPKKPDYSRLPDTWDAKTFYANETKYFLKCAMKQPLEEFSSEKNASTKDFRKDADDNYQTYVEAGGTKTKQQLVKEAQQEFVIEQQAFQEFLIHEGFEEEEDDDTTIIIQSSEFTFGDKLSLHTAVRDCFDRASHEAKGRVVQNSRVYVELNFQDTKGNQ